MVRELERVRQNIQFPETAPAANPVFFRTYSRRRDSRRETWEEVCDRTVGGLAKLGQLLPEEAALLTKMQRQIKTLTSGRWLWVGGSQWIDQQENFSGAYNCSSSNITDWRAFGLLMDLAMMGCGTGAVLEPQYINQLPAIRNRLEVTLQGEIGATPASLRREHTEVKIDGNTAIIYVGDSRQGWVESYQSLLELSTNESFSATVQVVINISDVRAAGETLKGFGGVANPVKLPELYHRCAAILNKAVGRQLNSVECCLLIDEAAVTIVAGNIRRCIAYGTRVSAISGMKFIQDVQVGDLVLTSSGEYRPVVNKFIQGNQDVVEIRTPATSIRCTANHRVAVYDGLRSYTWKYAGELQKGDRLISIPHLKGLPNSTTDWAWLVGFFIGDGHADLESTKRRNGGGGIVSFAISIQRLQGTLGEKILRIISNLGYHPAVNIQGTHANINIYRKEFAETLGQYKQPWKSPIIPEFIWQGNREIRAAFIAGLSDADGTPSRNVLVNSNKLEFLREVQKLALSLGIATTLHERKPKTLKGRDKIYEGCHWIHIRGLQSQAVTVALINQFAVRDGFTLKLAKKNGLSLPHQLVRELAATGWKPETICRADVLWADPKGRSGHFRDANFDTLLAEDLVNPHWLPMEVQFVAPVGEAETFDIEVEGDHEFVADGLLVHNSAGMRQFDSEDKLGASAKDNLWQQDEQGNWRIDPERDALRMANHSRVFHYKPTLEECIAAVRKQYFSGEGAIQWAGEAVARANCDLLSTKALKTEFLQAYHQRNAKQWLQEHYPKLTEEELAHRLARVGLNPCVTADTWIHTEYGAKQVKDLIGVQHGTFVNGELFSTTAEGFFFTGFKPVVKVQTQEGYSLRLTANHQVLKVTAQTEKNQYSEWCEVGDLKPGDRLLLHNHRYLQPWQGNGTFAEGYAVVAKAVLVHHEGTKTQRIDGNSAKLKVCRWQQPITMASPRKLSEIEGASYEFVRGFLSGLFDTEGSIEETTNGVNIRWSHGNLPELEAVQRMLLRLGIVSTINIREKELAIAHDNVSIFQQVIGCQLPEKASLLDSLLANKHLNQERFKVQITAIIPDGQEAVYDCTVPAVSRFDANGFVAHNCGEIIGSNFHCNLSEIHLNQLDPDNLKEQEEAFRAGALSVAVLLNHKFIEPRYQYSRELDPIVGVSFTGLFDFFVKAFGTDWLRWWAEGRPETKQGLEFKWREKEYLSRWCDIVHQTVWDYCDGASAPAGLRHHLKQPNRCTTVQPSGTKSLLTGASPGWHPPKAQRFLRRITFRKNDPVALACIEYGYNVIPSQSDKDEKGNLLDDPFDPRCSEWLVEIPVAVSWADLPGADQIDISKFSAIAQMDFYMQVQKHYVRHNTSATIELREGEIETLGTRIYEAIRDDEGYISVALLARFDDLQTFPRLPFEPISKEKYEQLMQAVKSRRKTEDFHAALSHYDSGELLDAGPAGCDSDKCLLPEQKPEN